VKKNPKADNEAALGYVLNSSLAGCANRRRYQGRHQSRGDRFLLAPDLCDGENQNGGSHENDEEASCWSTRGEHAPVGSGDLPAEAERVLRQRCLADSTSEHARGFDSRTPQPLAAPGQFLFRKQLLYPESFRWDEERRFLLRCELDAALFHLYLGTEHEWRQQPAALTQSFPTPRDAVSYIMDTFPIVKRKDEARTEQKNAAGEVVKPGR